MKRIIIDYSKLNQNILDLLVEKFPAGYKYKDIITFQTILGNTVKAVEVSTEDTVYLVKISSQLERTMENYSDDDIDEDFSFEDQDTIESEESEESE